MKILAAILAVIGALAIAAAIVYYTVPAHSLPSILGTLHLHTQAKRVKRGEAALIIGIVLWVAAAVVFFVGMRMDRNKVEY